MHTFIMLTRMISEEVNPTFSIRKKEMDVAENIRKYCPQAKWLGNYAVMGPWDYLDIFQAPDMDIAMRVSVTVRHYGGCHTEIWPAVAWDKFSANMGEFVQVIEKT